MKSNYTLAKLSVLAITAISVLSLNSAQADTKTYVGTNGSSWDDPLSWNPNGEPTAADDAVFDTSGTFNLTAGEVAQSVMFSLNIPNLLGGDLTVSGTISRLGQSQSDLNNMTTTANSVVISNMGFTGNAAALVVRNGGSLTVGSGGLTLTGIIDGATQRPARLNFRGGATPFITLQGNVTVNGHGQFGNASVGTNQVRLEGLRAFTVNGAGTGLNANGTFTVAGVDTFDGGSNAGSVSLANGSIAGSVIKSGTGTMNINTASTYTDGTTVNEGTLVAAVNDSLGTGNVVVNSALLTLGTGTTDSDYIDDLASLILNGSSVANLNFIGTDIIAGLSLGGVSQGAGVYNASTNPTFFTGGGSLTVVPEPGTAVMLMSGIGMLMVFRRRLSRRNSIG